MNQEHFEKEKQKSEVRYNYYKALTSYPEWKFFVEDMKEQAQGHKNLCVGYSQSSKMEDAKRQGFIVEGIEEALSRPQDVIGYHESFFMKVKRSMCALCGNFMQKVRA